MLGPLVLVLARTLGVTFSSSDELSSSYRATDTEQLGFFCIHDREGQLQKPGCVTDMIWLS